MVTTQVPRPHAIAHAAALLLLLTTAAAHAHDAGSQTLARVEFSGTSIQRLAGESAQPLQTI